MKRILPFLFIVLLSYRGSAQTSTIDWDTARVYTPVTYTFDSPSTGDIDKTPDSNGSPWLSAYSEDTIKAGDDVYLKINPSSMEQGSSYYLGFSKTGSANMFSGGDWNSVYYGMCIQKTTASLVKIWTYDRPNGGTYLEWNSKPLDTLTIHKSSLDSKIYFKYGGNDDPFPSDTDAWPATMDMGSDADVLVHCVVYLKSARGMSMSYS